jgi:Ca2+-transporting ATPase
MKKNSDSEPPETSKGTTDKTKGLTSSEVKTRQKKFGPNKLITEKGPSAWSIFFAQLKSPLVYIILFAAIVSFIVGEYADFGIIMAVVIVDAVLGFIQEYQAQQTYSSLRSLVKPTTTVIRNSQKIEIDAEHLVPGDVVVLNAGEHIPGDGIVIDSLKLIIDESILTGESEPVNKTTDPEKNSIFMGTTIVAGRGLMEVTSIGASTELGKIATSLGARKEEDTPLQIRLKNFSKTLTRIVVVLTALILIIGISFGNSFLDMLRVSIILAIAAVPEGLLIAVTVILVLGMRKILNRNGLVKKLLAVETLGSVTVICTDKTGTLTEGRMRVTRTDLKDAERALQTMVLCNNLEGPVDIALWEFVRNQKSENPQLLADRYKRLNEEFFTSENKFMITHNNLDGSQFFFLKGAPEIIIEMCNSSIQEKQDELSKVEQWAGDGLRLIGLAYRQSGSLEQHSGYIWVGLVAMEDPIRTGVKESILIAHKAGIKVKMITGDYARTAENIGIMIGLHKKGDQILEGDEIARLDDSQLQLKVKQTSIFSRIRPQDKLRIIRALQANGEVTAMIGDGVNDAPALKHANIGVVVGTATDVAKETADLILLDSNFSTIVASIEEGRVIFENIRKVVAYTLSNSFAEVLTIFGAMMLRWPAPLAVAQILWIHLICDGPSDIVLGFEPKEEGIMKEKPKSSKEPILTNLGLSLIGVISIVSSILALILFGHFYNIHGNAVEGRSIVFASFAVNSMIYIFAYRSMRRPLYQMNSLAKNKPLIWAVTGGLIIALSAFAFAPIRNLLGIVPLSLQQWIIVAGIALSLLLIVEIAKYVSKRLKISAG